MVAGVTTVCQSGSMTDGELTARECIRDLVSGYAHAADRGRFDEVAALFAPDGVLVLPDGDTMTGRDAVRDFLAGTGAGMRTGTAPTLIRHHVSSHHIIVDGLDAARGWAYFFVITDRGPDHWGRYVDRYARHDGVWRFASRRVRLDGWGPNSHAAERRSTP